MKQAAAMTFVATIVACATSPTGRKQVILFPESDVTKLGIAAFDQIKQEVPISRDPRETRAVQCVAKRVTAVVPKDYQPASWEVRVFRDETPNAFALPGGRIGVHSGMLKVAENPSQLATVIGHEIGHVMARHTNERLSTNALTETGAGAAAMLLGGNPRERQAIFAVLGVGTEVGVVLPFSRAQENEADLIGIELMTDAGFDPRESVELWKNMAAVSGGAPPEFLSTHPSDETRMEKLAAEIPRLLPRYQRAVAEGRQAHCEYAPFAAKTQPDRE